MKREWDMTTEKGREALERFLMRQMGWQYGLDPHSYSPAWFGEIDGKRWVMPKGWVFGPTGVITLKRWAAEKKGIVISSEFHPDGAGRKAQGIARCWELVSGKELALERADIEEEAVALALARALEEKEGEDGRGAGD